MMVRRGERGELQVGCIIGAIVLLVAVVIAIKVIPAMMKVYEFQDEIVSIADRASTTRFRNKPKKIIDAVISKAEELNLRVAPDDVEVTFTKKFVTIEVKFEVELEFPGYTRIWSKEIKEERPVW